MATWLRVRDAPYECSPPRRDNILTVGMCGFTSTRAQLARYTGEDGVTVLCNHRTRRHRHRRQAQQQQQPQPSPRRHRDTPSREPSRRRGEQHDACDNSSSSSSSSSTTASADGDGGDGHARAHADVLYHATCAVAPRLLHNVMPAPEVHEVVHCAACVSSDSSDDDDDHNSGTPQHSIATASSLHAPPSSQRRRRRHARARGSAWQCCRFSLNPVHWLFMAKELAMGHTFRVRPRCYAYSSLRATNLGGCRDQRAFTRDVRRAVRLLRAEERAAVAAQQTTGSRRRSSSKDGGGNTTSSHGAAAAAAAACDGSTAYTSLGDDDTNNDDDNHGGACRRRRLCRHLVLFGVSRGATTCFYSAMKLPRELAAYVSLVLLEAPFDTLRHVTDASCWCPHLARWLFRHLGDYRDADDERDAYTFDPARVQLRCPLAFVMTRNDRRVPNACTMALIQRVRETLVPHVIPAVEVLVLEHSAHPNMTVAHKDDQDAYVRFVERLYDTYCT